MLITCGQLDLGRLKRETEADHRLAEDALPLMQERLDRTQYRRCLGRLHGFVGAYEKHAAATAPEWMRETLHARRRVALLKRDLEWFGAMESDTSDPILPEMNSLPALLGAMYVMEGSTLGGQLIARHVAIALDLRDGQGTAYFRGHGDQTGRMWKEFCEMLMTRVSEEQLDMVVISAKSMFAAFGNWMSRNPAIYAS